MSDKLIIISQFIYNNSIFINFAENSVQLQSLPEIILVVKNVLSTLMYHDNAYLTSDY